MRFIVMQKIFRQLENVTFSSYIVCVGFEVEWRQYAKEKEFEHGGARENAGRKAQFNEPTKDSCS
jgi:hypothetical protein